jgi:hypothetical protein
MMNQYEQRCENEWRLKKARAQQDKAAQASS